MIALLCGYTYGGTLPGIFDDIDYISSWCERKDIPYYVSTDDLAISKKYGKQFNLNTLFLDMKDTIRGKKVLFMFSGHGKQGMFKTSLTDVSMQITLDGLASLSDQLFAILDCCEVSISHVAKNATIISASSSNTKSGATVVGSLFITDLMDILRSRDIRDICEFEKKLHAKHPDSRIHTSSKLLYGWVVPGTHFDYDPVSQRLYYFKDGVQYQLTF